MEIFYDGQTHSISADLEVVLSLGAINTPKVLMQQVSVIKPNCSTSGSRSSNIYRASGITFKTILLLARIWEPPEPLPPTTKPRVVLFWRSESNIDTPNLQILHANFPLSSPENAARFGLPVSGWTLLTSVIRPKSRGRIRLTGSDPLDPVQIEANHMCNSDELRVVIACVKLCREIGNSAALRPFVKREEICQET